MYGKKDDERKMHPEERERHVKTERLRKFYNIDVKAGDIVQYKNTEGVFYGLVVKVDEPQYSVGVPRTMGQIQWSTEAPNQTEWHTFDSRDWSVMNR